MDLDTRLSRIGALADPMRRALYQYVAAQAEPVTREQAADALDVPLHVAKFNLDRLVDEGLLAADYRRPSGRGGPGAGRPAKCYRRADLEVAVSLPTRRYDLAARLLLKAVARSERSDRVAADELQQVAYDTGRDVGAVHRAHSQSSALLDALAEGGYEPRADRDCITLANCPFHVLVGDETELVCGMNQSFVQGLLDGMGATGHEARLDPAPGRCCVRVCEA